MKTIVKGAIRDEKGYVLTLVLVLLVLGGLIIGPLLGLMSTGLIAGRVYENKMHEYYAADAGIEHGLWRLLHEEVDNINWPLIYELPGLVNNKEVRVAIEPAWLLEGLPDSLNLPDYQPSQDDPRYGNDHWTVTGSINIENTANYIIDITSDETNAGDINVGNIGVWLPPGYGYVSGSTEINGVGVGENETVRDPDPLEGILQKDGTVLIWHFDGVTFKTLSDISQPAEGGCTPAEKFPPSVRLSFDYETVGSNYVELVYDASGIFTPPAGVTNVTVEAWGGGGGGGGRSGSGSGGAGGGGGGAYAEGTVSVTPGTTYTVTVGAGGAGGLAGNNAGSPGGDSSFVGESTVLAKGGAGGGGGPGGTGGAGGSAGASIGSVKYSGGNGAAGRSSGDYRSGGGGGGAGDAAAGGDASGANGGAGGNEDGGDGADGLTSNGPGGNGTAPGGGGSGARRTSGGARAGGAGGSGKVLVCYWTEEPTIARGFFSWIKLGDADDSIAWDSQAGIFHIVSQAASDLDLGVQAGTTVETYTVRSFRRYSPGTGGATSALRGDYIAIGNSLMTSCWETQTLLGPPCDYICPHDIRGLYHPESSATIDDNAVPADARIEKAYLYWTAYLRDSSQPDGEVTLRVNDEWVGSDGTVEANKSYVVDVPVVDGWQYSCFADVTSQVKPMTTDVNGTKFTVGGVSATAAEKADCGSYWCDAPAWNQFANAAWSMIIIYSSQEKETHQIYLYHDNPLTLLNANVEFSVTGFEAPEVQEGNMEAQLGVFVAEGDPHYYRDYLKFKGAQSPDFYSLGDPGEYPGTSDPNPYNNVFNGKSTATGFVPSSLLGQAPGRISGFDMDVYTKDKDGTLLSDIVKPGDTTATIRFETGNDYIMLVYVVFSVRSTVALGEGFDVGTMTYKIG